MLPTTLFPEQLYLDAKLPVILCNGIGFNPTWHTLKDNMENISRATLQKVGEVVLYTLYNE